jgi:AcrR family transcriptional regulator
MAAGRPRGFDADEALDRALTVFWEKGYEGASLADLTAAMGISPPSLYAAFGNKEQLFEKVLDRYEAGPAAPLKAALDKPTAAEVAKAYLEGALSAQTGAGKPQGCLMTQGALACGSEAEGVRATVIRRRKAVQTALRSRLEKARTEGDLPPKSDPAMLARYLTVIANGMAVLAAEGESRKGLEAVVRQALAAWPELGAR